MNPSDYTFLYRCIELARKARRDVLPNPYVGAVLVHQGKIIGEGFHQAFGEAHAEVHAIASVADSASLPNSTLYVSLEPCSHFGKTPPCVDLVLQHKIPRVVIGVADPNPQVDGGGISRLRNAGVEVELAENPLPFIELNKVFWVNQLKQRTFITLKWAETMDAYMAGKDEHDIPYPIRISHARQNREVHALRAQHHAILIGNRTASIDDPSLTTRHFHGRDPIRILMDRRLMLEDSLTLFNDGKPTWILNELEEKEEGQVRYVTCDFSRGLTGVMEELYQQQRIASILVEGGKMVLDSFLAESLHDEIFVYRGRKQLGNGLLAPSKPSNLEWQAHRERFYGNYLDFLPPKA